MITCFNVKSADDLWEEVLTSLKEGVGWQVQEGRGGKTLEKLHVAFSIQNPLDRWMVSRNPPINPAFAIAEVVWILTGRNDSAFLRSFFPGISEFQGNMDFFPGAYGTRLKKHYGIDQLERAYEALKSNSTSRQIVLQIWDPTVDFPKPNGEPTSRDIPCNITSLLKVRNGALEWTQIIRSNDAFRGLPYNIIQFTTLQEILAGWLDLRVGSYNQISDSLHFYSADIRENIENQTGERFQNTDSLMLPKEKSTKFFEELAYRIDIIRNQNVSQYEIELASNWDEAPIAYRNLSLLMSAEIARRRGWPDLASKISSQITNPVFRALWLRWFLRNDTKTKTASKETLRPMET